MTDVPVESNNEKRRGSWRAWLVLLLLVLVGCAIRVLLSFKDGHLPDVNIFVAWAQSLAKHGLSGFYTESNANYPPLHILTLWGLGSTLAHYDPTCSNSWMWHVWSRLPACLADILIATLLFVECRRLAGTRGGLLAACLYFLNPVSLYNSAYWGQVDSIHTLFVLYAVIALNRAKPTCAGLAIGLALLQKLQSIAFLPLVLFDVYRWWRWRGLARCGIGMLAATIVVLMPFWITQTATPALSHGYGVVGQYDRVSVEAFNLWQALLPSEVPGSSTPLPLVRWYADGECQVPQDATLLFRISWRGLSMVLFSLMVAVVLTLHGKRAGSQNRALAAALLGLVFFSILTEMHERYSFPVIALLPIWVLGSTRRERIYWLVSLLFLLNMIFVQGLDELSSELSAGLVLLCLALIALLSPLYKSHSPAPNPIPHEPVTLPPPSKLVQWFGRLTWIALFGAVSVTGFSAYAILKSPTPCAQSHDILYLSDIEPESHTQAYGQLRNDASTVGGVIHLADTYYLKGLGTHALSSITYIVPEGYHSFHALVGVNKNFFGTVKLRVLVNDSVPFSAQRFDRSDPPQEIRIDVHPGDRLTLVTEPAGTNKGDHVDWALARFEISPLDDEPTPDSRPAENPQGAIRSTPVN